MSPLLTLTPKVDASSTSLVFDISSGDDSIAELLIQVDPKNTPLSTTTPYISVPSNTIKTNVLASGYDVQFSPLGTLSSGRNKLHILSTETDLTLDTDKLGPLHLTSLGALEETAGVGWQ